MKTHWNLLALLICSVFLSTSVSAHSETLVGITEDGFSPDYVKIHTGNSVIWVNRGSVQHWPASDAHPTHTIYPGSGIEKCTTSQKGELLDSCRGLEKGEGFEFVFKHTGKWSIHDHLYPGNTMIVEVVGEEDEKLGRLDSLKKLLRNLMEHLSGSRQTPENFRALDYTEQQKALKAMAQEDPATAWKFLKKAFVVNGQIKENPHELAHMVGNSLYTRKGIDGIAACDPTFAFGCYHGVTEKMLLALGVDAVPEIESACIRLFPDEQALTASCVHGTGHGLLTHEGLDVGAALEDCDALTPQHRAYCYDGVFMENSFSAPTGGRDWSLCAGVDEKYHSECAKYHVYAIGASVGWNFSTMAASCEAAPKPTLKNSCFSGLGFFFANAAHGDEAAIEANCGLAPSEDGKNLCTIHAAVEVIFQEYADWPSTSEALCESVSEEWKKECKGRTEQIIAAYKRTANTANPPEIQQIKNLANLDEQVPLYHKLIERVGPAEAQEALYNSGLPFTGQTHLLNHVAGEYLYEKYGAEGLALCKDYFLASCYHGFIIRSIGAEGLEGMDEIMKECKKLGMTVTSQCSHAMGHGFLAWVGYENIPEALDMCNEMTSRVEGFPGFNCRDGVFMENVWGVHEGKPSEDRWIKDDDLFYPCNDPRLNPEDLDGCWANQPSLMYQLLNGDVAQIGKMCLSVTNTSHKEVCFNALARQIHPLTKGDAASAFEQCSLLPGEWADYCLDVIAISDFSVGGRAMSFDICSSIKENSKKSCYEGLFGAMSVYARTPEEHARFCGLVMEEEWKQTCEARMARNVQLSVR